MFFTIFFANQLLEIYRTACRVQRDGQLGVDARKAKVAELDDAILALCGDTWSRELPVSKGPADDFRRLVNELMLNNELVTFVTFESATSPNGKTHPASGTNNKSERQLLAPAQCRDTGRAGKTAAGCRRKSVITNALSSLSCYLCEYTLEAIIREVESWTDQGGGSCFERLAKSVQFRPPDKSVLDSLPPIA